MATITQQDRKVKVFWNISAALPWVLQEPVPMAGVWTAPRKAAAAYGSPVQ